MNTIEFYLIFSIALAVVISLITMVSNKLRVATPILLVLIGLCISFIPQVPQIRIEPDLIFYIFLPPLLFEAAWNISWKEMWRWRRIITSFAFIVVFLTASVVALVANQFLPGFSLVLGFLLGGIVSPPDAVSASAITKYIKIPRRMSTILEGESLFNDASSLVIVRFALLVMATGQFFWHQALLSFTWMIVGGIGVGILLAYIFVVAHKRLPTDADTDTVLTLIAPYIMYIVAESMEASGVMAVVCSGLFIGYRGPVLFGSSTHLRGINVWRNFVFLLNGVVFILIGLDLPEITRGLAEEGVSLVRASIYGVLITLVLILVRLAASYGAVAVTLFMRRFIKVADGRNPGKGTPLVLGWTGMRGVVSLASALSIPLVLSDGTPFPQRSLILYITFIVITLTIVVQGLTLPLMIRKIKFPDFKDHLPEKETEQMIRQEMLQCGLDYIRKNYGDGKTCHDAGVQRLVEFWNRQLSEEDNTLSPHAKAVYIEVLRQQRTYLYNRNRTSKEIDEEIIRRYLYRIDLEEERINTD